MTMSRLSNLGKQLAVFAIIDDFVNVKVSQVTSKIWYIDSSRESPAGAQIIFPKIGRALGHVTHKIFGIRRSNISSKVLELETSSSVCSFVRTCRPIGAQIISPKWGVP